MNTTVVICTVIYAAVQVFIIYLLRERKRMTTHERYTKRLDWFKSRIGKRVYRNAGDCDCPICMSVGIHGLFIVDDLQATYLRDCEADLELYYADTRMQVRWWLIKRWFKRIIK